MISYLCAQKLLRWTGFTKSIVFVVLSVFFALLCVAVVKDVGEEERNGKGAGRDCSMNFCDDVLWFCCVLRWLSWCSFTNTRNFFAAFDLSQEG